MCEKKTYEYRVIPVSNGYRVRKQRISTGHFIAYAECEESVFTCMQGVVQYLLHEANKKGCNCENTCNS